MFVFWEYKSYTIFSRVERLCSLHLYWLWIYSIHFVQRTRTTGSGVVLYHRTMLSPCLTLGRAFKRLTFAPVTIPFVIVAEKLSVFVLTDHKTSRRHLVCTFGQLQITVELDGVDFGAGPSLVGYHSVHGEVKLASCRHWRWGFSSFRFMTDLILCGFWIVLGHCEQFPLIWRWHFGCSFRPWQSGVTPD